MEKLIREGRVAVLVSPGYGAGWYTWNENQKELLFHPALVRLVEEGRAAEITKELVKLHTGLEGVFCGGAETLKIHWIEEGTAFTIEENCGYERISSWPHLVLVA